MAKLQSELQYWRSVAVDLDYSQDVREYAADAMVELLEELNSLEGGN